MATCFVKKTGLLLKAIRKLLNVCAKTNIRDKWLTFRQPMSQCIRENLCLFAEERYHYWWIFENQSSLEFWDWLLCNVTMSIKSSICCYHLGWSRWPRFLGNKQPPDLCVISVVDFRCTRSLAESSPISFPLGWIDFSMKLSFSKGTLDYQVVYPMYHTKT